MYHTYIYQGKQTVQHFGPCGRFARPRRGRGEIQRFEGFYSSKLIILSSQVKPKFASEKSEIDRRAL